MIKKLLDSLDSLPGWVWALVMALCIYGGYRLLMWVIMTFFK